MSSRAVSSLNSVANTRILKETPFEELFVQPAAGDGGGALGAALWASNTLFGKPRNFTMQHAYWGRSNSDAEIGDFLKQNSIPFRHFENEDELLDHVRRPPNAWQSHRLVTRAL